MATTPTNKLSPVPLAYTGDMGGDSASASDINSPIWQRWLNELRTAVLRSVVSSGMGPYATVNAGNTVDRPVGAIAGTMYFDTTLGIPVWAVGASWVNAAGVVV
jgi:hypothetical protein